MIYLDSAATTLQKPYTVGRAMSYAVNHLASPGRGGHAASMRAADAAFSCREEAAALFNLSDPERVVFTMNATHALNIAIKSLVKSGDTVVISSFEHNAVSRPLYAMENVTVRVVESELFDQEAAIQAFDKALTPDVSAAVFTHVSNVFGFVLPIEEIATLCRTRNIPFIIDASQSAGCLEVDMKRLGASFVAMPGHKGLMGPQGTGLLLCNAETKPLIEGGTGSLSKSQMMPDFLPDRLEGGTHNMPGIAGLLEGIRFVRKKGINVIAEHERRLVRSIGTGLNHLSGTKVFLARNPEAQVGVLSFLVDGRDCESVGEKLSKRGIAVRAGLHCAPLAHECAGTLETGTVRVSVSPFNHPQEVKQFLEAMRDMQHKTTC